jgi:DNA methylase
MAADRAARHGPDIGGFGELRRAALDASPISGLTHRFYRYPARFSPTFAAAAITQFSKPGALIADPYMGGATTIVEALRLGRRAVGCDVNSLSVFIARVKTTPLTVAERKALELWAQEVVPSLMYTQMPDGLASLVGDRRTKNLTLPMARPIKKVMGLALLTLDDLLPSDNARNFARCALLNVGQWALNGRTRTTPLPEFRTQLTATIRQMLTGLLEFEQAIEKHGELASRPFLINDSAEKIGQHEPFDREKAECAVSSPPYPGIHMLYHRWQVDGRRESPAPYWLAACQDGQGAAFYNFADRREQAIDTYFVASLRTLKSIRGVMKDGGMFVQMVAFSDPDTHLPRYLENMRTAGFEERRPPGHRQIHRQVPSRRWHATLKGASNGAREVVLVHRAV